MFLFIEDLVLLDFCFGWMLWMRVRIGIFWIVDWDEVLFSEWLFFEVIDVVFGVLVFVIEEVVFLVGVLKYCFFFWIEDEL